MAYYTRNLGRKKEGDKVNVRLNINKYSILLFKKNDDVNCFFSTKKNPISTIEVDNFKTEIIIPTNGFWVIAVKSNLPVSTFKVFEYQ